MITENIPALIEAADRIEALTARLAAARDAMCELDGHYQKALAGWDAERTAREALEARLAEAVDDRDRYGRKWAAARAEIATLTARLAEAEAALATLREKHPEPDGVVEEPPRDNAITDAW